MAFKLLDDYVAKQQAEYMSHVRSEFLTWMDRNPVVTFGEFESFCRINGMNSYERELMYPRLDNNALAKIARQHLDNCQRPSPKRPCVVYDDAMIAVLAPLMIERLAAKS